MEHKVEQLIKEFTEFKREWQQLSHEMRKISEEFADLKKEIGTNQGQILAEQVSRIEERIEKKDEVIFEIERNVTSIRKTAEYNESNLKEIMKALSLIYRNVDELEKYMIPEHET